MGRPLRTAPGDCVYHVLNRTNGRVPLFAHDADYAAFERVLMEACERVSMRILAYCIMPNHWHVVLWPRQDGDLSRFMGWLTLTHTQRWHAHHHTVGHGHLYQGRASSRLWWSRASTSLRSADRSSAMPSVPASSSVQSSGDGEVRGSGAAARVRCR